MLSSANIDVLKQRIFLACRHLLSQQDRDLFSPTSGCFDRRYWAWKIADFPESTYQRNVLPLAWALKNNEPKFGLSEDILIESIALGIEFAIKIQHKNGSFDQAFPNEYSFGATAFLLHPLLIAYKTVKEHLPKDKQIIIEDGFRKAAVFLTTHEEAHGFISNHIAGAALSLIVCGEYFQEQIFKDRAIVLLDLVVSNQNEEGWYLEYDGADPGYQTLCVYYLAQCNEYLCNSELKSSLNKSSIFLSYFFHPDGSFGGEYGSRKTAIAYGGGISLLAKECSVANALMINLVDSVVSGKSIGLYDVDFGNFAPLLSNYVLCVEAWNNHVVHRKDFILPCFQTNLIKYFPHAGITVYAHTQIYAIASKYGVVKVFDRNDKRIILNELGYVASLKGGELLSSQSEGISEFEGNKFKVNISFSIVNSLIQTPFKSLTLRLLNLTFMKSIAIGNMIKRIMVLLLIKQKKDSRINLIREVYFLSNRVKIIDQISIEDNVHIQKLELGKQFIPIHMASSRYFPSFSSVGKKKDFCVTELNRSRQLVHQIDIPEM